VGSGLYEQDLLVWSEQQADLLERLAAGERVNERVDWPNLIEEVRDLGLSELKSCRSWITLAILHLFKLSTAGESRDAVHWTDEIDRFLSDLHSHCTPPMAQRIDVGEQYAKARRKFAKRDPASVSRVPEGCPFDLNDFVADDASVPDLLSKLESGCLGY
jgi:hypothetical protein